MSILLKGKNINLRKLKKSDAESLYLNANDYDIAKFTTLPHPYKLEHALGFIKSTHRKIRKQAKLLVWQACRTYTLLTEMRN